MLRSLASRFLSAVRSAWRPDRRADGRPPAYAGDFTGTATVTYAPDPDGVPDPGEIVWTWVPFEEDHSLGKDRPVLIVSQRGSALLCVMLTSKDHDGRAREKDYIDIGTGSWDPRRRPSEVKVDRVLQIDPGAVRREGAILERERFDLVAASLRERGWR
ncbi:type II toxin-antitoxin system PemK/MazF family toxin [Sinomonas sp. ASV486]|uniref:Type II toxin-antitoxin system PemK/MazF family toxin n=1 Tax=Sinomonas puerhi TaxID=3238584 RepID=A0AB39KXQ1_9MICC|nr:type II toxin-antitoxin system PemK/MazF family toxin [Sinomonas sp. ASV486]MDQ4491442.1 type II toxin-antitoxin system PemK/MazF family toxin [Sinomonas sp. ASV486]